MVAYVSLPLAQAHQRYSDIRSPVISISLVVRPAVSFGLVWSSPRRGEPEALAIGNIRLGRK